MLPRSLMLAGLLALGGTTHGAELIVPSEYPDLGAAVAAAAGGDTISVEPGSYSGPGWRDIIVGTVEWSLYIRSLGGRDVTSIDLGGGGLIDGQFTAISLDGFTVRGGGLDVVRTQANHITITSCRFEDNDAYIASAFDFTITLRNSILERNRGAASGVNCPVEAYDCEFIENTGAYVLTSDESPMVVERCRFIRSGGVAIRSGFQGSVTVIDSEFLDGQDSAIVTANSGPNDFHRCVFRSNHTTGDGAAVRVTDLAPLNAVDCLFADNSADGRGGALFQSDYSPITCTGCTFVQNDAPVGSVIGGWSIGDLLVTLERCLLVGNTGSELIYEHDGVVEELSVTCTDIWSNPGGDWTGELAGFETAYGNFSADPLFCEAPEDPYAVEPESPCQPGNHPDGADCDLIGWPGICEVPIGVDPAADPIPFAVRVRPNPAHGSVRIAIRGVGGPITVQVFDVAGRRVFVQELPARDGLAETSWDGTNQRGVPVAPGRYYARVVASDLVRVRAFAWMR